MASKNQSIRLDEAYNLPRPRLAFYRQQRTRQPPATALGFMNTYVRILNRISSISNQHRACKYSVLNSVIGILKIILKDPVLPKIIAIWHSVRGSGTGTYVLRAAKLQDLPGALGGRRHYTVLNLVAISNSSP